MKLRASGRGRHYSAARGVSEAILGLAYGNGWAARAAARLPRGRDVRAVHHRLALLPMGTPRLRLGFVSDLHLGPTTAPSVIAAAWDVLAAASPDVLVLGGDLVYLDATEQKGADLAAGVARVGAPLTVGVWGNHDLWTTHDVLERHLAGAGLRWLVNEALRLPAPWDMVALCGLDEPYTGDPDPDAMIAACGDATVRLAVSHAPEGAPSLFGRVDVVLSGHTHGGQLALPGGRPIWVPGAVGTKYPHGRHDVDGTALIVSRGVGGVEVPLRLFAPPDVLVIDVAGGP